MGLPRRSYRPREALLLVLSLGTGAGCVTPASVPLPVPVSPNGGAAPLRPCRVHPSVTWLAPAGTDQRRVLDPWCDVVGPPVVRPAADGGPTSRGPEAGPLTVISWNTHGGVADVDALLRDLAAARAPASARGPIVLLLQEVVRRSPDVPPVPAAFPAAVPRALHGDASGRGVDVEALAGRLGLSLVYVPSMRNGRGEAGTPGADRGNAVLSSAPITDLTAIELPFGQQRRVAVAATIALPRPDGEATLRVVSFHLDTRGGRGAQAAFLAAHLAPATGTPRVPLVVGGDVNALWGTRDAAYVALASALPVVDCGRGPTNRWPARLHVFLGWWRGRLDYVFSTLRTETWRTTCQTWPDYLGSDHLPVVLTLQPMADER